MASSRLRSKFTRLFLLINDVRQQVTSCHLRVDMFLPFQKEHQSVICKSRFSLLILFCAGPVTMDEAPSEEGSHPDKRSQPRVLQPDLQQESSDLKDECKEFVNSACWINHSHFLHRWTCGILRNHRYVLSLAEISQYQKIVEGLIEVKDEMTKEVETEKMKVWRLFLHKIKALFKLVLEPIQHSMQLFFQPIAVTLEAVCYLYY